MPAHGEAMGNPPKKQEKPQRGGPNPHFSYDVAFVVIGGWIFHVLDLR